jgi:hypothetical protein
MNSYPQKTTLYSGLVPQHKSIDMSMNNVFPAYAEHFPYHRIGNPTPQEAHPGKPTSAKILIAAFTSALVE